MTGMRRITTLVALSTALLISAACADKSAQSSTAAGAMPDSFRVAFETTRGTFVVQINKDWAPKGADRFYTLVSQNYFDDTRFFRVVPGFIVQFGLSGDPKLNAQWRENTIADDSVRQSNVRGTITFATRGPNTRANQLFINFADNPRLDEMGFAPIGRVVEGMSVVDSLYADYGEAPDQELIQTMGNSYLDRTFPKLDRIKTARISLAR
jgi:peptidyl-prolyl cis-trans isomerase A (cyclophilin A)